MKSAFLAIILRDLRLAQRASGFGATGVMFYLATMALMPFALGPDLALLARLGAALLWIGALLSTLIGLERIFESDHEDGSLDQFLLSQTPFEILVLAKLCAYWASAILPLILVTPLLGLMLGMTLSQSALVCLTLMLGSPALTGLGGLGAALTASVKRGGLLLPVLVLPLTIPIVIFGVASCAEQTLSPAANSTPLIALCGLSLMALATCPFAIAFVLRSIRE